MSNVKAIKGLAVWECQKCKEQLMLGAMIEANNGISMGVLAALLEAYAREHDNCKEHSASRRTEESELPF